MKTGISASERHGRKSGITEEKNIRIDDHSVVDEYAPLSILSFNEGDLHADFRDCKLCPGIYGTIFKPVELLDTLTIKGGVNVNRVRLAAQFMWSQSMVDGMVAKGREFHISSNLSLTIMS